MWKFVIILLCLVLLVQPMAYAGGSNSLVRGVSRILAAPFQIPKGIVSGLTRPPFPIGVLTGAVMGTVGVLTEVLGGVIDVGKGAAPLAQLALPFLL